MKPKILLWIFVLIFLSSSVLANLDTDVIVAYTYDDAYTSGSTSIDKAGHHNGTITDTTTGVAGKILEAYDFDGNGDKVITAATSDLELEDLNYTINFWANPDDWSNTPYIVTKGGGNNIAHYLTNAGVPSTYVSAGGSCTLGASSGIVVGGWSMVSFSRNTTGMYIYINGTLKASGACSIPDTAGETLQIGEPDSGSNDYNGQLDEITIWGRALNVTELEELFNSGAGKQYPYSAASSTDIDFAAQDDFNSTSINNFSINVFWPNGTNQNYSTSTGTISLTNVSESDMQINVSYYNISNYLNYTFYDESITGNTTNTITGNVYQAYACFNATEKISNNSVTPNNFTISSTVRIQCFNLTADTHNVMASLSNYDTKNQSFTITALSNATYTIQNMSYNTATIYAKDITTGAYLSNYQLNLTSLNYTGWVGEHYASTTNQSFELINGTYTVKIDMPGYALTDSEVNLSITGDGSYTFQLYPTNSLNITFYDEDDGSLLSGPNISMEIILNDTNATIGWTTNGTIWFDNIDPGSYEIRYRAEDQGYEERSYFFTLTNRTFNSLNLYLMNNTGKEDITITLYDEYGNKLEGYIVKLMRYYASENGFLTVDQGSTNTEGQTVLEAIRNGPYYKFRVTEADGTVIETTSSTQIYQTSMSLYVTLGTGIGELLENLNGVSHELSWLDTNQFKFTWDNSDNTVVNAELKIYAVSAGVETLYNSSSLATSSGTIYLAVANTSGTTYLAKGYVTFSGDSEATLIDTLTHSFDEVVQTLGNLGLFLTVLILIVLAFSGIWHPAAPCLLVPAGVTFTKIANLHALEWTWIISLWALGIIIAYLLSKGR